MRFLTLNPKPCHGYSIDAQDITVPPTGGTFTLSSANASQLVFPSGAVTDTARYHIEGYTFHGQEVAGYRITPLAGAPTVFNKFVDMRIGFAGCPWENQAAPFYIARVEGDEPHGVGGVRIDKYVDASVDHFSDYLIAE